MIHQRRTGADPAPGPDQSLSGSTEAGLGGGAVWGRGGEAWVRTPLAMATLICCSAGASGMKGGYWVLNLREESWWRGEPPLTTTRARPPAPPLPEWTLVPAGPRLLERQTQKL